MTEPAPLPSVRRFRVGAVCVLLGMLIGLPTLFYLQTNRGFDVEDVGRGRSQDVEVGTDGERVVYGDGGLHYDRHQCVVTDRETGTAIEVRPVEDGYERSVGRSYDIHEIGRFDPGSGRLHVECELKLAAIGPPETQSERMLDYLVLLVPAALLAVGWWLLRDLIAQQHARQ